MYDRPAHADERLVREDERAFGDGVDVAGQAQLAQVLEEARLEQRPPVVAPQRGQVLDILVREVKVA